MKHHKLCWQPWFHLATLPSGDVKLCCIAKNDSKLNLNTIPLDQAWNSDYYKQARLDMLEGKPVNACEVCWKEEDLGIESHRIIMNREIEKRISEQDIKNVLALTDSTGNFTMTPPTLDIRLGNTCNLECVMCKPSDSSKWVSRAKHLANTLETKVKYTWIYHSNIDTTQFEWYKGEKFWKDFEKVAPELRHMTFGGGEPLYVKEHKNIIKYLVDTGHASHIELHYHTNGTIYDQEVVDIWSNFKSVKVMLSIDGYKEVNNYIRRPSKWQTLEDNLRKYDLTPANISVAINTTVQMLNVFDLPVFAQWLLDQKFTKIGQHDGGIFFSSLLHYPDYLTVQVLPEEAKADATARIRRLIDKYPTNKGVLRMQSVIDYMNSSDQSELLELTVDFLEKYNNKDTDKFSIAELDKYIYSTQGYN